VLLYGEWVEQHVLAPVAHRQYVFTLPRLRRPIFARRRKVHEADPLVSQKCKGPMRVIALIDDPAVVRCMPAP
jgi:hypothetical protein